MAPPHPLDARAEARLEALLDGWAPLTPQERRATSPVSSSRVRPTPPTAKSTPPGGWSADKTAKLRRGARDPRWRVRELVAQALQRLIEADGAPAFAGLRAWANDDDPLVVRAAVAGVAEPACSAPAMPHEPRSPSSAGPSPATAPTLPSGGAGRGEGPPPGAHGSHSLVLGDPERKRRWFIHFGGVLARKLTKAPPHAPADPQAQAPQRQGTASQPDRRRRVDPRPVGGGRRPGPFPVTGKVTSCSAVASPRWQPSSSAPPGSRCSSSSTRDIVTTSERIAAKMADLPAARPARAGRPRSQRRWRGQRRRR